MNKEQQQYLRKIRGETERQRIKLKARIQGGDWDGAITSSKTFLEGIFENIHVILLGIDMPHNANDLRDKFNIIKKLLKLDPNKIADEKIKSIFGSISSIISNTEDLSNIAGDRHFPKIITKKSLATFMGNLSIFLAAFLYERIEFLYSQYPTEKTDLIYKKLIEILNSSKRALNKDNLLKDVEINYLLSAFDEDEYVIKIIINKFISDYEITRYRESDIFFASMRLFFDYLTQDNIKQLFIKCKDNDQACGLLEFLEQTHKVKADLLDEVMVDFLNKNKNEQN
jgi:hypothetical protein